jgi:hypothetical protein
MVILKNGQYVTNAVQGDAEMSKQQQLDTETAQHNRFGGTELWPWVVQ